jgi:uncharacterized membrane protein YkvA (DUF1232 family)
LTRAAPVFNVTFVNPARTKRNGALLLPVVRKPGAIWRYLKNPSAPKGPKLFLLFAVAYVLMPLDLIPDMAPIITWLDDFGVASLALSWVAKKAAEQEQARVELLAEQSS